MLELERHKNILKYLHNKKEWIKGKELAEVFEVSDRTIRTDMVTIKKILGNEVILSSKTMGYYFNDEYNISQFIQSNNGLEPADRLIYITKKLILYKNGINSYDLADELFISESTINSDILRLKKIMGDTSKKNMQLIREGEMIILTGDDYGRNSLLSRVIKNEKIYIQSDELSKFFTGVGLENIAYIIIENLEKYKFISRYISIMELTINILLILERTNLNIKVRPSNINANLNLSKEYEISRSIMAEVEEIEKTRIDNEEIENFAYVLWSSSELENEELRLSGTIINDEYIYKLLLNILTEIKEEFCMDFTLDDEFIKDIGMHTKVAMKRVLKGICICNPIKEQMIAEYPFLFDVAIYLSKRINDYTDILLKEEEISFLVAHIGVAVDKAKNQSIIRKKLSILLIVLEGRSTLKHIVKKLCNIYDENLLNIYSISSPYSMEEITKKPMQFDLVIATSKFTVLTPKQDIIINPQFTIVDEINLREIMDKKIYGLRKDNFEILFNSFFHKEIFCRNFQCDTKEKTIDKLCDLLKEKSYVDEAFKGSVHEREELISTALENKVALPHATNVKALKSGIALCFMNKSIDWAGRKVKVVFLFAVGKDDIKNQREVYDFIVKIVSKDSNIAELLKCNTFEEFRKLSEQIYLE